MDYKLIEKKKLHGWDGSQTWFTFDNFFYQTGVTVWGFIIAYFLIKLV